MSFRLSLSQRIDHIPHRVLADDSLYNRLHKGGYSGPHNRTGYQAAAG